MMTILWYLRSLMLNMKIVRHPAVEDETCEQPARMARTSTALRTLHSDPILRDGRRGVLGEDGSALLPRHVVHAPATVQVWSPAHGHQSFLPRS